MLQRSTPSQMNTFSECLERAVEDGYTEEFEIKGEGDDLSITGKDKTWSSEDIQVENFYRFEGASDPADSMILYLIRTNDDVKGTLSDGYGMYADEKKTAFMKNVEQITKKV